MMVDVVAPWLPAAVPAALFVLSVMTAPPDWVKPRGSARRVWVLTHLSALVVGVLVGVGMQWHPWYEQDMVARVGAGVVSYVFVQGSQTDLLFRKASEVHMMFGWSLFMIAAAVGGDSRVVSGSVAVLFLAALTRRWWAGDATALCVALSCVLPVVLAHPMAAIANYAGMGFVLVCGIITAVAKSRKRPIAVPLVPIALAPFVLVPAILPLLSLYGLQ
jgi:hypothetical protein